MNIFRYKNRPLHAGTPEFEERERVEKQGQADYQAKISQPGYKALPHSEMIKAAKEGNQRHLADAARRKKWKAEAKAKALNKLKT